jgi:hypothetical protein
MKKPLFLKQWLLFATISTTPAFAQTVVVSDCDMGIWQELLESTALIEFVTGPGSPPLPKGSIQYSLGTDGGGKALVGTTFYANTPLSSLTELKYWTYVQNYFNGQAPAIEIYIDNDDNDIPDDRLVFEPIYQNGTTFGPVQNGGAVLLNTWQQWDALIGGWWTAHDITSGPPTTTIPLYLQSHPNATILIVTLTTGGGPTWDNFVGNADALKIGVNGATTTYNFEPCKPGKKVTICHKGHTISISVNALKAHLENHGDTVGPCEGATTTGNTTAVEEELPVPAGYKLTNHPNPFAATTRIQYSLPFSSNVSIKVYDLVGREITTLLNGYRKTGSYTLDFNASHLGNGIYFYVLQARSEKGLFTQTKSMILQK